jgi:phospholipid/cholesterol/gamma-HCH transport system permease protein
MKFFFEKIGNVTLQFFGEMGEIFFLILGIHRWMFKKPFEPNLIFQQMVKIGVDTLPVSLTTALFTGMVLALQTGFTLETKLKGATQFLGAVVSLSMVRELGPVLTALIAAGRIGSSIAAEIGTMKVTEQLDALNTLAANPVKYLAVPRFLAFTFMLPFLTIFSDLTGWFGGLVVSVYRLKTPSVFYIDSTLQDLKYTDILGGLLKALVFGAAIAIVCCQKGFSTEGGAEGVGKSTTSAVVVSFMVVLIADYFITAILTAFHL